MATTIRFENSQSLHRGSTLNARALLSLGVCMGLPLGVFGLVNLGAEQLGILPLFFAPFGLPGWVGATAHLTQLALLGAALFLVLRASENHSARNWLLTTIGAYIVLPFITPPLDSLQLALVCSTLFLLTLATLFRVASVSTAAAWLMAPTATILGFSAVMGLAIGAAYAPPFALMQGQQAGAPAAADA